MRRRAVVVAPVDQRRGAAVELVQRTDERGDVQVLGLEHGREARRASCWKYSSSVQFAATPRSAVCQVCMWALIRPGNDDAAGGVDDLGIVDREVRRDLGDAVAGDQDVGDGQHALPRPS